MFAIMAGGDIPPVGSEKDYPGRFTAKVLFTCITAATGGLIFGYDLGISGNVKLSFYSISSPGFYSFSSLNHDNIYFGGLLLRLIINSDEGS